MVRKFIDSQFRALDLKDSLLDISQTRQMSSIFEKMMIPNVFLHAVETESCYQIILKASLNYGEVIGVEVNGSTVRDKAVRWIGIKSILEGITSIAKEDIISLLKFLNKTLDNCTDRMIDRYKLWKVCEISLDDPDLTGNILSKLRNLCETLKDSKKPCDIKMLSEFKSEVAAVLLMTILPVLPYSTFDKVSQDCVDKMLILIVEFQWQLTDISKDPDDLLNDLLNCSLSSFHTFISLK